MGVLVLLNSPGSVGSVEPPGSAGSLGSIGSPGSVGSSGSPGSVGSIGSVGSVGSAGPVLLPGLTVRLKVRIASGLRPFATVSVAVYLP
ncbi:MAG: hypothetical protein GX838_03390 [Clostridiaceae bacterium]|nr:hypothetical protein [Clostridiaceae bacterium]